MLFHSPQTSDSMPQRPVLTWEAGVRDQQTLMKLRGYVVAAAGALLLLGYLWSRWHP